MTAPPRIVVAGASGFIGATIARAAGVSGCAVVGLGRREPVTRTPRSDGPAAWVRADLAADQPFELPQHTDAVIHAAGLAHVDARSAEAAAAHFRVHLDGTRRLLEAARRVGARSFVYLSSVRAAGAAPPGHRGGPLDEDWSAPPETPYGRAKRAAEAFVLHGGWVPHPIVLRPTLVYGPRPKGNLAQLLRAVERGRFLPIPRVRNRRSLVHVEDLAAASLRVLTSPAAWGRTFVVADDTPCSTRELYEWACAAAGRAPTRWAIPRLALRSLAVAGDLAGSWRGAPTAFDSAALERLVGDAWYSSARLQRATGWRPEHTLRASLPAIVASLREGPGR